MSETPRFCEVYKLDMKKGTYTVLVFTVTDEILIEGEHCFQCDFMEKALKHEVKP